ncbi:MAG: flavin monoamine oxidase family protein [Mycobacteriaceae bacterium]
MNSQWEIAPQVVSRRKVLLAMAAGLGTTTLASCSWEAADEPGKPNIKKAKIVIIGAGFTGLAAAHALKKSGADIQIIEARDRPGGRVFTQKNWYGAAVDLGASWIHGQEGNPITELAKESGAETIATSYESSKIYLSNSLKDLGLQQQQTDRWENLVNTALDLANEHTSDVSIGQAISEALQNNPLTNVETADLQAYLNSTFATEYGSEITSLSAQNAEEDAAFSGEDLLFPSGYSQIVDKLSSTLAIEYGVTVNAIDYSKGEVLISTNRGDYRSDAVLVTVPLGVLKAQSITFTPTLPEEKNDSINSLGVGTLSKTFLKFESSWWPKEYDWHQFVGNEPGLWSEWVSLAKTGEPILLGFNSGTEAKRIEAAKPDVVLAEAMSVLKEMFGTTIPQPQGILTTTWSLDPLAHGSYSFYPVGSSSQNRKELGTSIGDRVFFAGEATHTQYPGTVHGAWLSGQHAAEELQVWLNNR